MQTLQVVLGDEVAELVRRAAEKEARSVSSWLRLLIERELAEGVPRYEAVVLEDKPLSPGPKRQAKVNPCRHSHVEKAPGAGGGIVKTCRDCGLIGLT